MIRTMYLWLVSVAAVLLLGACTAVLPQRTPLAGQPASVLSADALSTTVVSTSAPATQVAEGIDWRAWEPATFALAQAEDKLILLDLTAVWCHWCHVMDTTTYADPAVIELVNAFYIAIRVDTDQRPDVTARYLGGGWPTTAILAPNGDKVLAYTCVPPEELISLLQKVNGVWAEDRDQITAHVAELQKQRVAPKIEPATGVPTNTVKVALTRLVGNYDDVNGGFGWQPKFLDPSSIELILRTNDKAKDPAWSERVTHTLAGLGHLIDPVWGGIYRYSVTADWQTPHYEKMLDRNAQALRTYLAAYQATGMRSYRERAEAILQYVERFLSDPAGGFYSSQDADLYLRDGGEILMQGEAYFTLTEKDRIAAGIPHVDQAIYADANGQMITALLQAATALDQPRYQEVARKALDRLWREGRGSQGQMLHGLDSGGDLDQSKAATTGTLNDQTQIGLALLAAYSITGRHDYLSRAEALAHYVLSDLRNPATGAFYDLPIDPTAVGELALRQTPCRENVVAARFFTKLYRHTRQLDYRLAAESVLRLCATTMGDYPDYALAVDDLLTYPLTLAVVGTPGQAKTDALLAVADRFYWPGKVVTPLDPALGPPALGELTYPPDRAAIYACSAGLCSAPVENPQDLADQVTWLSGANQ